MAFSRILVRATNWVGDAVMSLPAIGAVRARFPDAYIAVLARPWVAGLYARETSINRVLPYEVRPGFRDFAGKLRAARELRDQNFDCAILLQNAFEAAALAWLARIPTRIGYARDGRGLLLTHAIPLPKAGEIPRHQRYYYLELLRRANLIETLPETQAICLDDAAAAAREGVRQLENRGIPAQVIGVSPGAAYGNAKRWLPERFAEAALEIARPLGIPIVLFGSAGEHELCESVARLIRPSGQAVHNLAGATTLAEFIGLAAACRLFLTNDSGAMHIASALGVPTIAIFGSTDEHATGPTGPLSRIIREPVECSPCLLRECPIDHRCMERIPAGRVVRASLELLG